MTDATLTIEGTVHITRRGHGGRPKLREGPAPTAPPPERVPRVARIMALASTNRDQQLRHKKLRQVRINYYGSSLWQFCGGR